MGKDWAKNLDELSRTVEGARTYLRKSRHNTTVHMALCTGWISSSQLQNLYEAEASGKNEVHIKLAIREAYEKVTERDKEQRAASAHKVAQKKALKKADSYSGLSSTDLLELAQEMTEVEVEALLKWERNGKNRLSVVRQLTAMLADGAPTTSPPARTTPRADASAVARASRAVEADNERVRKAKRGTMKVVCPGCAYINAIDYELLQSVLSRRANSSRGRAEQFVARNRESGLRLTGRHGAASTVRANELTLTQLVASGFPCASCGEQLIK